MDLQETALLNNWLKVVVLSNGDLALKDLTRDKETGNKVESVIAIYSNQLNLLADMGNLLVKRAIYLKQITSFDDFAKLNEEFSATCRAELNKLNA
ncbi:hypothetical protein L400_01048 [Enterobacter hormaechei]|uniref:DUF5405 family protein n=1 Tax=Enterobacter hormaechei TaxID=158836 RepID=UPI0003BEBF10|nr:DUF5405 family protein [Enterobacter hormaechei]HDT4285059.1 DUF5405 family protein [Enterobacter hormaechei subsp. xiangfangensis]EKZ1675963.1 DUF5405 family protein [Enterobacter hormaechei]ESM48762.1 hypothetical protein L400_01048 [Enterobacter hormaechei]MCD0241543.1 DUF5405 family protein [Enterobacter hormaechei]MCM7030594.1 DUF5405 family protein [Enterobacter hormaechei]